MVVCCHFNPHCLTAAWYFTNIHCLCGSLIITPVSAIDLEYPIVPAFGYRVVVYSSCVIIALIMNYTHPCEEKENLSISVNSKWSKLDNKIRL